MEVRYENGFLVSIVLQQVLAVSYELLHTDPHIFTNTRPAVRFSLQQLRFRVLSCALLRLRQLANTGGDKPMPKKNPRPHTPISISKSSI